MSYRKSVFFARLKRWMACLWPSRERRRILRFKACPERSRTDLLNKQDVSSTPSRPKTVLTRVKKISLTSWLYVRPKISNYAKQTQFSKCQKRFNFSKYKELQRTMRCGLLCKTNPIKPNFSNGRAGSCYIFGVFWRTLDVL